MQDADLDSVNDGLAEAMASMPRDEPAEAEPSGETEAAAESEAEPSGQPRDPATQRFMPKQKAGEETEGKEPGKGNDDDRDTGAIPAWRLREIREERDRIAAAHEADRRELEAMRRQMAEWQRQRQEMRQQQEQVEPDPMVDLDGWRAWLRQQQTSARDVVANEIRNWRVNMTFADAHEQHGDKFDAAYAALQSAPQEVKDEVMDAINPGKALMRWDGHRRAMTEIGDDFDGFRAKERQRLMADPEFRKEFMAAMEAEARGNSAGRSSTNVTDLPSVNRVPGGGGRQTPGSLGGSDREIFESLTARR